MKGRRESGLIRGSMILVDGAFEGIARVLVSSGQKSPVKFKGKSSGPEEFIFINPFKCI